jgi:succinoglycan biosynthesis protein ExoA
MSAPLAAVIIPTLNEEAHIAALLHRLLRQTSDRVAEIIVADGGSRDNTREIVAAVAREEPRVRLVDNPRRIQSAAFNTGAAAADPRADVLVRIDAHAEYPDDFVAQLLDALAASGGESVVVRMVSVGKSCFQRGVAAVSNSVFGTGGAAHRVGGTSRFIDHGHHAAFDRRAFSTIGGYDEAFVANEDAEFDVRLRAKGGRIWFASEVAMIYYPRATARSLARQYYNYGRGRAQTMRKHGERPRLRQLLPPAMVTAVVVSLSLAIVYPIALALPSAYLAAIVAAALLLAVRARDWCVLSAVIALPIIHFVWAAGLMGGLLERRRP